MTADEIGIVDLALAVVAVLVVMAAVLLADLEHNLIAAVAVFVVWDIVADVALVVADVGASLIED